MKCVESSNYAADAEMSLSINPETPKNTAHDRIRGQTFTTSTIIKHNGKEAAKKDYPGKNWPDNHAYLRCAETANCSAGAAAHHKHEFRRHYNQFHPNVVYNFASLIRCTYKEHTVHVTHQKSLPGGRTRNYTMFRKTPVQNLNPRPQALTIPAPLATPQPLATSFPLAASRPLATLAPLDTSPPLLTALNLETWSCTLCSVPVGGVWAAIDHIATGHHYTEVNHDAGTKMIHARMEEGEIVEEMNLVLQDDGGRTWLLAGRVE